MKPTLDTAWAVQWLRLAAKVIAENRMALIELDRVIGDGDHGENMDRGFSAVLTKLDAEPPATPGAAFKLVAMTLMSKVGGAAGPLYGTAFLRAASAVGDAAELDSNTLAAALAAARDGVVARGKASVGEKTMIDAWTPAVDAASAAAASGATPAALLAAAATAAEAGSVSTDPLIARKGRASYLGERAIGHRDPGSVSSALILRAAAQAAGEGA
ncbi:dihydroxyacetone kinase subunit DhaL [Arthrobacter psychrochitiniphilus]|uniref:Dihydroxyacetone kinase subunit L n=1 Tax=Arthrobacter psychrochitiniphilus TaxID=291045 RepID=A0A2V3DS21_9MICC|nr:dihydroxyacetone kinase subunit DhaL [Arthrobacter psychrochitiniphilus]NYG19069.1 dihydroxyacetone kinase-like protein [Arthrobacter psychrochitiniphilus]PXA65958.1 dihydroxyacetone kinase subunit L [Arthrobacter psychrochitiniphilus]